MAETTVEYDRSVLGVEVAGEPLAITTEMIRNYCKAVGETNPLYLDESAAAKGPHGGIIAPPVFHSLIPIPEGLDPNVQFGNARIGGARHAEFLQPIRSGDTITPSVTVKDVYEKTGRSGRMVFVVRRTVYRNQRGETVTIVDQSGIHRNAEA